MISTRLLRPLAAAAFAAGLVAATPASAHTAAGTVVGTGTIQDGLLETCIDPTQEVIFDGIAVLVGNHNGPYNVHFDGTSNICETLGAGSGCGTLSGDVNGTVCYSRTANVVALSGNVTVDGSSHVLSGVCKFAPTSVRPVTTYALNCHIVLQ